MALTRAYRQGVLVAEDFPVAEVADRLTDPDTFAWVDFCGPTEPALTALAEQLGLHELAVEDALEPPQRPKLDHYTSHLFLSLPTGRLDPARGCCDEVGIGAFIGDRWLVTVRRDDGLRPAPVLERWDQSPDLPATASGSCSTA